jgi:hypothetical protein
MTLLVPDKLRFKHGRHRLGDRASQALTNTAMSEAVIQDTGITAEASLIPAKKFASPSKSEKMEREELAGAAVNLSALEPLLTAKQVEAEYGVGLGALTAVIELPVPAMKLMREPKEVYVFTQSGTSGQEDNTETTHFVMGKRSLDALHTAAATGRKVDESLTRDVLTLSRGGNEEVVIGRRAWLPDLGYDPEDERGANPVLREQFKAVSRNHATLSINPTGDLELTDLHSHNGTEVYLGVETWHPPTNS